MADAQPQVSVSISPDMIDEVTTSDEALAKITHHLIDAKKKEMITELNPAEVCVCSILSTIAKEYDVQFVNAFLSDYYTLKISKNRLGRREIIEVAKGSSYVQKRGFGDKLKSLLGRV